jgi:hypothetical protein
MCSARSVVCEVTVKCSKWEVGLCEYKFIRGISHQSTTQKLQVQAPHTKLMPESEMQIKETGNLETSRNLVFLFRPYGYLLHF